MTISSSRSLCRLPPLVMMPPYVVVVVAIPKRNVPWLTCDYFPSTQFVNKGNKKGRGYTTPQPLSENLQMTRKTTLAMSPNLHPQILALQQPTTRGTVLDLHEHRGSGLTDGA